MKKMISFIMVLLISVTSLSQAPNQSQDFSGEHYLKKSKTQKTTAWIMLGGGAAFVLGGYLMLASQKTSFEVQVIGFITGIIGAAESHVRGNS